MSELKMKSTKNVLLAVTGVTIAVGLHKFSNDDSVLKFMITDDNKQFYYLDVVILALKKDVCECYDVSFTTFTILMSSFNMIFTFIR